MGKMNRFDKDRFDAMGKEAMSRVEEIMNSTRLNELLHRKEEEDKKKNCILWIFHNPRHAVLITCQHFFTIFLNFRQNTQVFVV